jgi:DNA-binding beta-propeller fold protein YncE
VLALLAIAAIGRADEVVTIAGNGTATSTGDGGPAASATVSGPFGVTLGPDGALYVCETTGHRVRRIDLQNDIITTVAGSGEVGYAGDGGSATTARLNEPYELRFDSAGNMLFVEMKNHVVRRVDRESGVISTVAGTGEAGLSGDGGPATEATLRQPHSICLDGSDNLYICDIGNHRIRKVDAETGVISTFAGTGEKKPTPDGAPCEAAPLDGPRTMAFDGDGNLFLALREGNAVYRISLADKTLHHVAGTGKSGYRGDGGDARQADLAGPKGITVTSKAIYLADTESHTIRVIERKSNVIDTLVGDGTQGDGPDGDPRRCRLDRPHGVEVSSDGRTVFIGDSSNNRVRRLTAEP